jgi:hypothetical protein
MSSSRTHPKTTNITKKALSTHLIDVVPNVPQQQHLVSDLDLRPPIFVDEAVEHVKDHGKM